MTWWLLLAALPCVYAPEGPDQAPAIREAGIERVCVPPEKAESWRVTGVTVTPITASELTARESLLPPGIVPRPGVASPTRAPWVNANGWRLKRLASGKFVADVPAGTAPLAAAEAFAYDADVVLKVAPEDVAAVGRMFAFFKSIPELSLPDVSDFAVVDDGSAEMGEVMNLLSRRNLLFQPVRAAESRFPMNVQLGTADYPRETAADPSAFALAVRRRLTDERRSFRLYGSEVVVARVTSDGTRARLHLLNYANREIVGIRVRVRGAFQSGQIYVADRGAMSPTEQVVSDGFTELTIPALTSYAVVDLAQ
jgi:hypothetical protein